MTTREKLLQDYWNYLQMRNYSIDTRRSYLGGIKRFWNFCESRRGDKNFDKNNAVQTYLAYRTGVQHRDFSTVNGDYSALKWFYIGVLGRTWDLNKLKRPKAEKRLPRYISPGQFSSLVQAGETAQTKLLFLLYYSTGMRSNEGRLLKWEDIAFDEGFIHVRKGKGAKDRMVVLHPELEELLKEHRKGQREGHLYVFSADGGANPFPKGTLYSLFVNARRKANLPDWVSAHVLRHSYATTALRNGTDILSLQELLGHVQLRTTARYVHLNVNHLKRSYNPLSDQCLHATIQNREQPLP